MASTKGPRTVYACQSCGYQSRKWLGKCPDCGGWNTFVEERERAAPKEGAAGARSGLRLRESKPVPFTEIEAQGDTREITGIEEFDRVLGGGIVPGSLILIGGEPGIGKCLAGSTRILDPNSGAFSEITEYASASRTVLSLDTLTHRLTPQRDLRFLDQGVRTVVEVVTRLGRKLRCTPSHPMLTPEGWRAVGELTPGTRVAAPLALPYFGKSEMPEAEVKLIAYILSDGSALRQISVTTAIHEIGDGRYVPTVEELQLLAQAAGIEIKALAPQSREIAEQASSASRFLESLGLRFTKAAEKAVPDCIFQLPRQQMALFLKALFSCDGSVYVSANGQPGVSYSTISRRLAEDVQHLLLRFGIISRLRSKQQRVNRQG